MKKSHNIIKKAKDMPKNHHILIPSFLHEQVIIDGRIEKKESGQVYKGEKPPNENHLSTQHLFKNTLYLLSRKT